MQLYTRERLASYDETGLRMLADMVRHDIECPNSIYTGMTREETIETATQSTSDIRTELGERAIKRFGGVV